MTDREFILKMREDVFGAQCSLGSDGGLYQDLEAIVQSCNDHLAEVREVQGIRFRVYPALRDERGRVTVEAMVTLSGVYFDDRSVTCAPARVDQAIADLVELVSRIKNPSD